MCNSEYLWCIKAFQISNSCASLQEFIYSFKRSSSVCPSFKQEKNYTVWRSGIWCCLMSNHYLCFFQALLVILFFCLHSALFSPEDILIFMWSKYNVWCSEKCPHIITKFTSTVSEMSPNASALFVIDLSQRHANIAKIPIMSLVTRG